MGVSTLQQFIKEIRYVNRNPQDTGAIKLLDETQSNPQLVLQPGAELFRSRIVAEYDRIDKEKGFFGYGVKDSYVPPRKITRDMRANYRYIPYLYCADSEYISIIEVRPTFGADVSMARILVKESLRLLDFTMRQKPPRAMSDTKTKLFNDLSALFSKPMTDRDEILDYIPTQYIAEYAKNLGYDGIAFKSSLVSPWMEAVNMDQGLNIVVFNYKKCAPVGSHVFRVTDACLACEQVDAAEEKWEIVNPVNAMLEEFNKGVRL